MFFIIQFEHYMNPLNFIIEYNKSCCSFVTILSSISQFIECPELQMSAGPPILCRFPLEYHDLEPYGNSTMPVKFSGKKNDAPVNLLSSVYNLYVI